MEILTIVLVSICGGALFFVGFWLLITGLLRKMAGMTRELNADTGTLLRESPWGSGSVNGVRARGCLRVAEYERGWVVRIAALLGGGKLWLPKSGTTISQPTAEGLLTPRSRTIACGDDRVVLFGSLADFVAAAAGGASA